MSILSARYFHDEQAAFAKLESIVWPHGPICPHCGGMERWSDLTKTRVGLKKCGHCRKQFTARIGTVLERSHVPVHKWLQAIYLIVSSKKGISANQLARTLEVTVKTGWFMGHRIREAMRTNGPFDPMRGVVEVDETFIGHDKNIKPRGQKKGRGYHHKYKVLTLVERGGRARNVVVNSLAAKTIVPILRKQIASDARVMTDEAGQYKHLHRDFDHDFVSHGKGEYGRGEIHTNTIEGYFSIFKRGMKGVYQHASKRHLPRYLAEFDFRYNNRVALGVGDKERADYACVGIVGKRLTYRDSSPVTD